MRFVTVEKFPPPLCWYDHKPNCQPSSKQVAVRKRIARVTVLAESEFADAPLFDYRLCRDRRIFTSASAPSIFQVGCQ
jgi:hypothetical protein